MEVFSHWTLYGVADLSSKAIDPQRRKEYHGEPGSQMHTCCRWQMVCCRAVRGVPEE